MNFVPTVPFAAWAVFFAVLFTLLNLRGIKASSRTNEWITAGLGVVIILFFVAAARTIWRVPDLRASRFLLPFYDPTTFSWRAVSTGTSIAMLTYIGFDGISTLSEEAHDPRRNILLATVLTCLLTGVLAATQVYAAQLVWPRHEGFPDVDTAFVFIAGQAGGPALFFTVNLASWSPRSDPGPVLISPPAGCSTVWAGTMPFPAASSVQSMPERRSRGTTSSLWEGWR